MEWDKLLMVVLGFGGIFTLLGLLMTVCVIILSFRESPAIGVGLSLLTVQALGIILIALRMFNIL